MLLLEVVVALAIMVMAMGMLSAQLASGLRMTEAAEELTQASQLADRILALVELDPNTVERFFEERQIDGDFDSEIYEQYRGWFWRATVEELPDDEDLGRVTIEILHQRNFDDRENIEDAQIVRTLHLLKANPGRINLAEDFGVPEEQLDLLMSMIPIPGFDPTALDPQALVSLEPEMLLDLLPIVLPLLQQFSGGKLPEDFSSDMLRELMGAEAFSEDAFGEDATNMMSGVGGLDAEAIEAIQSMLGGQLSEEELGMLLSGMGQGGGGGRGQIPREVGDRADRSGRGRTADDLDRERDERNRKVRERRGGEREEKER
jgi:hypothetical protein